MRYLLVLFVICTLGGLARGQGAGLTDAQLKKLVGPVALYPDPLLNTILDASMHPSALVAAGDSQKQTGGKVDAASPASVKALLKYPQVLAMLDGQLSWTARLGNAYKSQKAAVMAAIQTVRKEAKAAGNLSSNTNQKVTQDGDDIDVIPTDADDVYIPFYDPAALYVAPPYGYPVVHYWLGTGWYSGEGSYYWYGGWKRIHHYYHPNYHPVYHHYPHHVAYNPWHYNHHPAYHGYHPAHTYGYHHHIYPGYGFGRTMDPHGPVFRDRGFRGGGRRR
ncbi:MAG: DUF3300 domain-containing protein [Planctomycetota bacterium]|nr:DUF3300 domain-containing protein [Planctomycetota bacterium]